MSEVYYLMNHPEASIGLTEKIQHRRNVSVRDTRASVAGLLQLPRVRSEHARKSFFYRAPAQ